MKYFHRALPRSPVNVLCCVLFLSRFMRPAPGLSLADTAATYHFCKQRLDRQGGAVLSSIRFACTLRPDRVEVELGRMLSCVFTVPGRRASCWEQGFVVT